MIAVADLTGIFDFIFDILRNVRNIFADELVFSAYGFTFSMWDFILAFFVLSSLVSLVSFTPGGVSDAMSCLFDSVSERIKDEQELANSRYEYNRVVAETNRNIHDIFIAEYQSEYRKRAYARRYYDNVAHYKGLPDRGYVVYGKHESHKKLK